MNTENAKNASSRQFPKLGILLVASTLAAIGSGFTMDQTRGRFDNPPPVAFEPTEEEQRQYNLDRQAALRWSVAACTGLTAGVLASLLTFGAVLPALPRAIIAAIAAGGLAILLAGVCGMGGQYYYALESTSGSRPTLLRGIVMQSTFWVPTALSVGLCAGIAAGNVMTIVRTVLLTLVGCIPASLLVTIVGTIVNAVSFKEEIPPETLQQCLIMTGLGTLVLGIVLYAGMSQAPTKAEPSTAND